MKIAIPRIHLAAAAALLVSLVAVPAFAQTPPRVVQAPDGTLYLLRDGTRSPFTPAPIGADELASIPEGAPILGDLAAPALAPVAPVVAPAAPAAPAEPTAGADVIVQRVRWASVGTQQLYITAAALIQNPNPDQWMPTESYTATAYDAAGGVIGSYDNVLSLGPGETRWVVVSQMDAPGQVARVDFQIRRSKPFRPASADPAPPIAIVQSNFQADRLSAKEVGQIRNDGAVDVPQVRIDVLYFDDQGNLLGTAMDFVQHLKPGEVVSFSASSFGRVGQPADVKVFAVPELLR